MTQPLFRSWWTVGPRYTVLLEVQRLIPAERGDSGCLHWLPHEPVERLTDAEIDEHVRGVQCALSSLRPQLPFAVDVDDDVLRVQAALRRGGSRPSDSRP